MLLFVADHSHVVRQGGDFLVWSGDDDDRADDRAEDSHDSWQHQLVTKREIEFRPTHAGTLAAAKDDSTD